jgi:taurine--2-oxoglutarate transaminase
LNWEYPTLPESFFITWNKQRGTPVMRVAGAGHDEFLLEGDRRVYDFTSTSFQASFGHSCQPIRDSIHRQLDRMPIASPRAVFELKENVSQRLLRLLALEDEEANPGRLFYTVSGSESVENALKIARHYTGRTVVLARKKSYHGASLGSMSVSGDWRSHPHVNFSEGTLRIPEPDEDPDASRTCQLVQQAGPDRIAAVIVETISGVNGVVIPPLSWWDGLTRLCRQHGILLICDEVLTGFGRTGPAFAFQDFQLRPDLVCMSKAITGGYIPFGAVWVDDRIASRYDDDVLACGLTNYAHPLGLAALDAVLDLLSDVSFAAGRQQLEKSFAGLIEDLADRHRSITGFRRRGLLAAIDFRSAPPAWQTFLDAGLYVAVRDHMLVLAPPFVSSPQRLKGAFQVVHDVLMRESGR